MKIDWELTPRMLFNQLSEPEREQVADALTHLPADFRHTVSHPDIQELPVNAEADRRLYVLRSELFRVVFARHGDAIVVVDLFPTRQIEKLRSLQPSH